ncbi:MAG: hypothetical protein ABFC63_00490 [Thermoguttaceae bacterium]
MRTPFLGVLTLALFCPGVLSAVAGEPDFSPRLHPWGRFEPGAWKVVRVLTETLDDRGQVVSTSTADTRTTLLDLDDDGVTLEVHACVEVAGKRFQAEPQTVKQGFHGEATTAAPNQGDPADGQVLVENRKVGCKVYRFEAAGLQEKTTFNLYCSMGLFPYVLKRECVTTTPDGKTVLSETGVELVATEMPVRLRGETRNGSYVKTVHKNSKGTVTTLAVLLPDVPGGIVSHTSKEVDTNGRVVRRSTLELLDYKAEGDHGANRRRSSRRGKP